MTRLGALACLLGGLAAGGCAGSKQGSTTPGQAGSGSGQPGNEFRDPSASVDNPSGVNGPGGAQPGSPGAQTAQRPSGPPGASPAPGDQPPADPNAPPRAGGPSVADQANPPVSLPSYDPEPTLAKAQVDQHLQVARTALGSPTPDPDTALREARLALQIDAASVDAAAMVAFAYYHKKLYDTAELVLDDLFKRSVAKQNPTVYYVYGLIYDRTNRPDQAVVSFKKAVELNPNYASALVNLGVHQLQNSQYNEAVQNFERLSRQFGRTDAVTLTSLGSAYRGHAADYPATSPDHDDNVRKAEAAYKRALASSSSYGPAYYNLGLLYLDNDPFPGLSDTLLRLNTSKTYFDQYKNMPNVDMKLYDDRMKDVTRAIKRAEKQLKKSKPAPGKAKAGATRSSTP